MGKRLIDLKKEIEATKIYSIKEAVAFIKDHAKSKSDESIDIALNLNIDAKKTDQNIRGSVMLPHGTGRKCRIAVFAKDKLADEAKKAGAEIVGAEDLIETVLGGEINFDACVATPDMMPLMSKVARVLGPKGLMPNPKLGTVTTKVGEIVESLKKGRVNFKNDKGGVVHSMVGKSSFSYDDLEDNIKSFWESVKKSKPDTVKGKFLKIAYLTSTQGGAVMVELS